MVYTEPDSRSQHALSSSFAVDVGQSSGYLDGDRVIEIAKREGCAGIHPGYGFVLTSQKTLRHSDHPLMIRLSAAQRECNLCAKMYRGRYHLYRPTMEGH